MPSKRYNTAVTFINAFNTLDLPTLMSLRAPNCTHDFRPASLSMGEPKLNDAFEAQISKLKTVIDTWPIIIKQVFEAEAQNTVFVWAEAKVHWRDEVKGKGDSEEQWDCRGEYMFICQMDESEEKIVHIIEFLDSVATQRLMGLVEKATVNLEGKN